MTEGIYLLVRDGNVTGSITRKEYSIAAYLLLYGLGNGKSFDDVKRSVGMLTKLDRTTSMKVLDHLVDREYLDVVSDGFTITEKGKKHMDNMGSYIEKEGYKI